MPSRAYGHLAAAAGMRLSLQVLKSGAGHYIGTADETGPVSRESEEYWATREEADAALAAGRWTQRNWP